MRAKVLISFLFFLGSAALLDRQVEDVALLARGNRAAIIGLKERASVLNRKAEAYELAYSVLKCDYYGAGKESCKECWVRGQNESR